jgi:hypothetical protein
MKYIWSVPVALMLSLLGLYKYYGIVMVVMLIAGLVLVPIAKIWGSTRRPLTIMEANTRPSHHHVSARANF